MANDQELPQGLADANNPAALRQLIDGEGAKWRQFSEAELVGLIGWHGSDRLREGAASELRRRSSDLQRESAVIQQKLIDAIDASGDCASDQTARVIKLTNTLRTLTWVLVGVGLLQVGLMVWDITTRVTR